MMSRKKKISTIVALALMAAWVLVFGFIQTPPGRQLVLHTVLAMVEPRIEMNVDAENLSGFLPFTVHLERVTVSDADGAWLHLADVRLRWSPLRALIKHYAIQELTVASARLERRPKSRIPIMQRILSGQITIPAPASLPHAVVDEFRVERLTLGEALYPGEMQLHVEGNLRSDPGAPVLLLHARGESVEGPPLSAIAEVEMQPPSLRVDIRYAEPAEGLLNHLAKLQPPAPIEVSVAGEGPLAEWQGKAIARLGDVQAAALDLKLDATAGILLSADGPILSPPALLPEKVRPLLNEPALLQLAFKYDTSRVFDIKRLILTTGWGRVALSGPANLGEKTMKLAYEAGVTNLDVLAPLVGTALGGTASMAGTVSGPFAQPAADFKLNAAPLTLVSITTDALSAAGRVYALAPTGTPEFAMAADIQGAFTALAYPRMAELPRSDLTFAFAGATAPDDTLVVERFSVKHAALDISASGRVAYAARAAKFRIDASAQELAYLTALAGLTIGGQGAVHADVDADLPKRQAAGIVDVRFTGLHGLPPQAAGLVGDHTAIKGNVGMADAETLRLSDVNLDAGNLAVTGTGTYRFAGRVMDVAAHAAVADLVAAIPGAAERVASGAASADITLAGPLEQLAYSITGAGTGVTLRARPDAMASAPPAPADLQVSVKGVADIPARAVTTDAALSAPAMGPFLAAFGIDVSGAAEVRADGRFDATAGEGAATLTGNVAGLAGLPPAAQALTGAAVSFDVKLAYAGGTLDVPGFSVTGEHAMLAAQGQYSTANGALQATGRFNVPELAVLSEPLGRDMAGAMTLTAEAGGVMPQATLALRAAGDNLTLAGETVDLSEADVRVEDLAADPKGAVRLNAQWRDRTVTAAADFLKSGDTITIGGARITAPGIEGAADVQVLAGQRLASGNARMEAASLEWLGELLGRELAGTVNAVIRLDAADGRQAAVVNVTGDDVATPWGQVTSARIDADIADVFANPAGKATVTAAGVRRGKLLLDSVDASVDATPGEAAFTASLSGSYEQPLKARTSGTVARAAGTTRVTLAELTLDWGTLPVALQQPAVFVAEDGAYRVEGLALRVSDGTVTAGAVYSLETLDANVQFAQLPLAHLFGAPELTGLGEGELTVRGTPSQPAAQYRVRLRDVTQTTAQGREWPLMDVFVQGDYERQRLRTEFAVERLLTEPLEGQVTLPLALTLAPFYFNMPAAAPVEGTLTFNGELETVAQLLLLDEQRLEGQFRGNMQVGGVVASPQVTGVLAVENGVFENYATGTVLRNVALEINAEGNRVQVVRASATDGGDGTLSAEGWFEISPPQHFPMDIAIRTNKASLVRRDDAIVEVDGLIRMTGNLRQAAIASENMVVSSAEITLLERRAQGLEGVALEEKNRPPALPPLETEKARAAAGKEKPPAVLERFALAVDATAPPNVLIYGYGLESIWGGAVSVRGTAAAPVIDGGLKLDRGQFLFLGRQFNLTEGTITFTGAYPPTPVINLVAQAKTADVTALVTLSGPVAEPKVTLSSTPELPNDEILARVLFGREMSDVSPIEAIQLAQAAAALAGGPAGLDVIGRVRQIIGLDRLTFTPGSAAGTAIGIGRQLGKNVRVDVRQGLSGKEGTQLQVEAEINPNLTVEGTLGQERDQGVGITWQKDY